MRQSTELTVTCLLVGLCLSLASVAPAHAQVDPVLDDPVLDDESTSAAIAARGVWALDERDIVELAAERNPALRGARLSVVAAQQRLAGEDDFSPWLLEASANYTHSDTPTREAISSGLQIRDTFDWRVSVAKAWSFGLELVVSLDNTIQRSETPLTFEVMGVEVQDRRVVGPFAVSVLTAQITQHLLRGRDMDSNLIAERAARQEITTAELAVEQQLSQTTLDVLEAYWELDRARRDLELRRRSIELIERQREITSEIIDAGLVAEIELDVLAQQMVAAEEAVLLAELSRDQAEITVRQRAGLELTGDRTLEPNAPLRVPPLPSEDVEALVELAQSRSYEIRTLEERLALVELDVERASIALEPTLDVFVRLSQQGVDDDIGADDGLFFEVYEQIFTLQFGAVSAGVLFSIPLDDDRNEAAWEVARTERERLLAEMEAARQLVESTVRSQVEALERNRERLGLLERSVELAERNLETGQERLALGRITTLDLVRLQEELEDAQARLTSARIDVIVQTERLEHTVGALLGRVGLEADPTFVEDAPGE